MITDFHLLLFVIVIVLIIIIYKLLSKNKFNVFHFIFLFSILIILFTSNYNSFAEYPPIILYSNLLYRYIEPFVKTLEVIAIALIGSVSYFYIQEYRTFRRNKYKYEYIARNLSRIIRSHLRYIRKNNLLDEKHILIPKFRSHKDLSTEIKETKKIKRIIDNNNLNFSSCKEMREITLWKTKWDRIKKYYYNLETNFETIENKIRYILNNQDFLDEKLSDYNNDVVFICRRSYFRAKYRPYLKRMFNVYIEILEVLEKPKLSIIKKL